MDTAKGKKLLEEIVILSRKILPKTPINGDPQTKYSVALVCTIAELTASCSQLMKLSIYLPVPILLRNILEAAVALQNLLDDPDYLDALKAAQAHQTKQLYKDMDFSDPKFANLDRTKIQKDLDEADTELQLTNPSYHRYANQVHSFALAQGKQNGRGTPLYTMYSMLCSESHNNLNALEKRHFIDSDIRISPVPTPEATMTHLYLLAALLSASLTQFYTFLEIEDERVAQIESLTQEVQELTRTVNHV